MKYRLLLYISIIALLLIIGSFLTSCAELNEVPEKGSNFTITVQYDDSEQNYVAFDDTTLSYTPIEVIKGKKGYDGVLRIETKTANITSAEFWIEKNGVIVDKLPLTFEENQCILPLLDYGTGTLEYALVLKNNQQTTYYVSTAIAFLEATKSEEIANQTICQLKEITMPEDIATISFSYPFVWNTNEKQFLSKAELHFSSQQEGRMVIQNEPGTIVCEKVSCNTPLWDYEIQTIFNEFSEEGYYFINAKSVNQKPIDTTTLYIDSMEKWNDFSLSEQVEKVKLTGALALEDIQLMKNISLYVTEGVTVNGTIDAPNADLYWEGEQAPDFAHVQQYHNVKSYNGKLCDANIGGEGTVKLLSGTILDQKINFTPDGNYIAVTMGYANLVDLSKAKISVKLDGEGTASIQEIDGAFYCIVTDSMQRQRKYVIQTKRKDYKLPIISITTDNGKAVQSKETFVGGSFSIDYNGTGAYPQIEDATMQIRGRGHSSWELAKKPYKIKFAEKTSLFGLPAAKEWVLQANHIDRSLMRNNLAMQMGTLLTNMTFIPHSYLVDVFVNGEYQGVYSLTEQIEMKAGKIPGEKDSTELDCDYLVEFGGEKEETAFGSNIFSTTLCKYVEIKTPDTDVLSYAQYLYIKNYFQKLDQAIIAQAGYEEYIDIPSLIDWFILHEFSYNTDCTLRRSNFFLKKAGGKLYVAAPWDFDYAFGNMSLDSNNYQEWISLGNAKTDSYDEYIKTNWMDYLLKDENFTQQLKARWNEVGTKLYQKALETINANEAQIALSAKENFIVWNKCLGVKLQYESKKTLALDTYEEQMEYLREFIKNRYQWMDKTIKTM